MQRCSFSMLSFLTHGRFVSLKLFLGFYQYHEDFDHTEIDRILGIEICLSNNSKSVVRLVCTRFLLTTEGSVVRFYNNKCTDAA